MDSNFIIAVDFDGTLVEHRFPHIGPNVPDAFPWLRRFERDGAKLILWTIRCNEGSMGDVLTIAVEHCRSMGINFWGINENPQQRASRWSTSGKVYAHVYIDDAAAGTPLVQPESGAIRVPPYVDWSLVGPHVMSLMTFNEQCRAMTSSPVDSVDGNSWGVATPPQIELPKGVIIEP
jgi:hypothetical protein